MKSLKVQFVEDLIGEEARRAAGGRAPRIMELGCGTARYMPNILKKHSNVEYVGVEPFLPSYEKAKENLAGFDNAKLHLKLGYDSVPDETEASFDLVFSLSTLEHIKQLERFIALSAKYLKTGGTLMHRYDLGHALTPCSIKERFQVFLGNTIPAVLPEHKFVRYVPETEVRELYEKNGVKPTKSTYHQMPNHKSLEKQLRDTDTAAIGELFDWEKKYQAEFAKLPTKQRELLFPAISVWGEKR